eukprot:3696164-Amphidinium_carterae.1
MWLQLRQGRVSDRLVHDHLGGSINRGTDAPNRNKQNPNRLKSSTKKGKPSRAETGMLRLSGHGPWGDVKVRRC